METFTPIQDQTSIWYDPMTESPCRMCKHAGSLPADECIMRGDCPLNTRQQISSAPVNHLPVTYSPEPTEYCVFPECKEKSTRKKNLCSYHNKIVYNRRVTLGLDETRWFEPVGK